MNDASLQLSLFFLVVLIASLLLYPKGDLSIFERGKHIIISRSAVVGIILGVIGFSGGMATLFLYTAGPTLLQGFYIALYTLLWAFGWFFFLPLSRLTRRIGLALLFAGLLLLIVTLFPGQLLQNIFMAGSLLWIGPIAVKKFRIPLRWMVLAFLIAGAIDAWNIFSNGFGGSGGAKALFSDEQFFLNGLILFQTALLGIGDIVFGILAVSVTQKFFGFRPALALAFLIAIPRAFLRTVFPELQGVTLPFLAVLTPITLGFWLLLRGTGLKDTEGTGRVRTEVHY
jgi:hypothetical protein